MYYLTTTARRKNAKRHICIKGQDIDALRRNAKGINYKAYIVEIYNGNWELVEELKGEER